MEAVNGKILVRCDDGQKNRINIGGIEFSTAIGYEKNYREKSPVICEVVEGNEFVREGQVLLVHHNTFYLPSPYYIGDELFSIPFGSTLFAIINADGSLSPICGNLLCDRVNIPTELPVPPELQEKYIDRVVVKDGGWSIYKPNDLLFTRPHSYYEIVYNINGEEKRVHKCHKDMVCGVVKAK
jgi:hypothetical protein